MSLIIILAALFLLPVDGFPIGMKFFREFGAQPTSILLGFYTLFLFLSIIRKPKIAFYNQKKYLYIAFAFLLAGLLNSYSMIIFYNGGKEVIGRDAVDNWILQFAMYAWMVLSIGIWSYIIDRKNLLTGNYKYLLGTIFFSSLLNIATFINQLFGFTNFGTPVEPNLYKIQLFFNGAETVTRASGLSTEPSYWAAWCLWIWPLLFLNNIDTSKKIKLLYKVTAIIVIILGLISTARTFVVVFLIQIIMLLLIKSKRHPVRSFSIILISIIVMISFTQNSQVKKLYSTFDISGNASSATRVGGLITALNIFSDFPMTGIGLGQFTAYYGEYVPKKFVALSSEISGFFKADQEHRLHTYSLPARILCEMGIGTFFLFVIILLIILIPMILNVYKFESNFKIGIVLTIVGGLAYWLQQDLFGYQPAIISLALCLNIKNIKTV